MHGLRLPYVRCVGTQDSYGGNFMKKVFIGGIGNVLLQDDGIGPLTVCTLASRCIFSSNVEVEDLGTTGLDLAEYFSGMDAVIVVDSIEADLEPGTIQLFRKSAILQSQVAVRTESHASSLLEALATLELLGAGPEEFLLVGVVGLSYELGEKLSECVRMAVEAAISEVLDELTRLEVGYSTKPSNAGPDVWWERQRDPVLQATGAR